jgi:hypothetical protein
MNETMKRSDCDRSLSANLDAHSARAQSLGFYPDIVIGLLLLWMVSTFRQRRIVATWIGVLLLTLWLGVHLSDWWIPYLRGTGSEREGFYRFYSARTQILPVIGTHRPPDGGHAILDLFVLSAFLFALWAAFMDSRKMNPRPAVNTPEK